MAGAYHQHLHARFRFKRIKIVKIRDARQLQAGDLSPRSSRLRNIQRVFGGQTPRLGEIGQNAKALPAGLGGDHLIAIVKQAGVAAKLVDDKAFDARFIVTVEHGFGAHHLGYHTAAINIAHQHNGHSCGRSKAHIGNVTRAQVYLCRRACAFDNHQIILRG